MKIDFSIEQLAILDKAIQQMPYYIAAPLVNHINNQIIEQQKIMDIPVETETE